MPYRGNRAKLNGMKAAASRIGISLPEYMARRKDGEKHCAMCARWALESEFYPTSAYCKKCNNKAAWETRKRTAAGRGA